MNSSKKHLVSIQEAFLKKIQRKINEDKKRLALTRLKVSTTKQKYRKKVADKKLYEKEMTNVKQKLYTVMKYDKKTGTHGNHGNNLSQALERGRTLTYIRNRLKSSGNRKNLTNNKYEVRLKELTILMDKYKKQIQNLQNSLKKSESKYKLAMNLKKHKVTTGFAPSVRRNMNLSPSINGNGWI